MYIVFLLIFSFVNFSYANTLILNTVEQEEQQFRQNKFEKQITETYGAITLKNITNVHIDNKETEVVIYILYKKDKNGQVKYTTLTANKNYEYVLSVKCCKENLEVLSKYRPKIVFTKQISSMKPEYLREKFSSDIKLNDALMMEMITGFMTPAVFKIFMGIIDGQYMDEIW